MNENERTAVNQLKNIREVSAVKLKKIDKGSPDAKPLVYISNIKRADILLRMINGIEWAKEHKSTLEGVALVLGSLTVGIGAYNAVTGIKTAMEAANTTTLHGLAAAQLKANLAFLASPITWVVAGITLLVGGFIYLWNTSEELRGFWIGLWDDITGFFGDAKEKISEGIDNIGGFFTSLPDKISGGISDFKESVKAGFAEAYDSIDVITDGRLSAVVDVTQEKFNNIKSAYEEHGGGIQGVFAAGLQTVNEIATAKYDVLNALTDGKLEEIHNMASEKFESLKNTATEKLEGIVSVATEKLDNMKSVYEENGGGIKGIAAVMYTELNSMTDGKLGSMLQMTQSKLNNIKSKYEENGGGIKGIVSAGFQAIHEISTMKFDVINTLTGGKLQAMKDAWFFKNGRNTREIL